MPLSSTEKTAKKLLDLETNARFWAQTNYKVGQKLDMSNPTDKAMSKVWLDIFAKVKKENAAGKLVLTYNNPKVEQSLANAAQANDQMVGHLEQGDAQAASAAHAAASTAAATAAAYQPPSVSVNVAQGAAEEASIAAAEPSPDPIVLPSRHPANSPAARPAVDPAVINPTLDALSVPVFPNYEPPTSAADRAALAQAQASPKKAAEVHQIASFTPPAQSSVSSQTISQTKDIARERAAQSFAQGARYLGILQLADGSWTEERFDTQDALDSWYGTIGDDQSGSVRYAATFVADLGAGEPQNDFFGGTAEAFVHVEKAPVQLPVVQAKTNLGPIAAVGAVAVAAAASVFAGRHKKKGHR